MRKEELRTENQVGLSDLRDTPWRQLESGVAGDGGLRCAEKAGPAASGFSEQGLSKGVLVLQGHVLHP